MTTYSPQDSTGSQLHVAAAVIERPAAKDSEILLTLRPPGRHQGGLWEFPGGKLEPGEGVEDGLRRELHEELGIDVDRLEPLIRVHHDYGDRAVLLDVWRVTAYTGEPHGREGQTLRWWPRDELRQAPMPAADRPIVAAVLLPDRYLITPTPDVDLEAFLKHLRAVVEARRIRLVQLRAKDLKPVALETLAARAVAACRPLGALVLINGDAELAQRVGAQGVHLASDGLWNHDRRPLPEGYWVCASCHTLEDLGQAERIGADFAVLSPVKPTASHPDAEVLGWERFFAWVDTATLPVFALGGMEVTDVEEARRHGAQGIAAIGGLWRMP